MTNSSSDTKPTVAIVGGGLAGLAAAAMLCRRNVHVELFESRRQLGGRAGSFCDPETGEMVDHCQHVAMGCCTSFLDFCRRTQIDGLLERHKVLHFFGPDGNRYDMGASRWLPAPLHLAPALLRLGYLSGGDRLAVTRGLVRLARMNSAQCEQAGTMGDWLRGQGQSDTAVRRFWSVVLVSALGELMDRVSVSAARKVFVDGFMARRDAYHVYVPNRPLGELYDRRVGGWLSANGVALHLGSNVTRVEGTADRVSGVRLADGSTEAFDRVVLAVPWWRVADILPEQVAAAVPQLQTLDRITASPITAIHLWFDRAITSLPHAVLIDRLSQWMFNRGERPQAGGPESGATPGFYYQVVISASQQLSGRSRDDVLAEVLDDLRAVLPDAERADLVRWRMVTDRKAVFSARPGLEKLRPAQTTAIPNLLLAGDWTDTGWPSTMEGAVRSGYLAAEAILRQCRA